MEQYIEQFINLANGMKLSILVAMIFANLMTGVAVSIFTGTLRLKAIGDFLLTRVLPYVLSYFAVVIVAVIEPATGKEYADFVRANAPVWQEAWRETMGESAVIRTDDKWDGLVKHLGYKSVSVLHSVRDTLARAITTDRELVRISQERLREVEIVPDERLDPVPHTHLKLAREITKRVFPYSPPAGIYAANIPPASDRVRTAGLYSTATGEVYIAMEQMPKMRRVIDTLVHELAHHRQYRSTGEADDLTPIHMEAMQHVAAEVVKIAALSELEELFKGVTW